MYAERKWRTTDGEVRLTVYLEILGKLENPKWTIRAELRKPRGTVFHRLKSWRDVATMELVRELQWEVILAIRLGEPHEV